MKVRFFLFCFIINTIKCLRLSPPKDLKEIKEIYYSWYYISKDKPVMTNNNLYFIKDNKFLTFNYNNLIFYFAYKYSVFENDSYFKPLDAYSSTEFDTNAIFFTKDCALLMYSVINKDYFLYRHIKLNLKFDELKGEYCYDSLKMYYDSGSGYAAIYNFYYNKIIVFNLTEVVCNGGKGEYNKTIEITMDGEINKALIYSENSGNKILLIGIDKSGQIQFWNLKNYCFGFFRRNPCEDRYLINYFNIKKINTQEDFEFSTIINKNVLLIVNNEDDFITFDLGKIDFINKQSKFISSVSCILRLKDGNSLVGTKSGTIYLIKYENYEIKILDSRQLCPQSIEIISLSSNNNCIFGTYTCYQITANCGGKIKIFEIKNSKTNDSEL